VISNVAGSHAQFLLVLGSGEDKVVQMVQCDLSPVELWTGSWTVPDDARTGVLTYTVTATDRFGRAASFAPFSAEASQLTIVE